jgi:hypothetical protein
MYIRVARAILFFVFSISFIFKSFSQIEQPTRFEIGMGTFDRGFEIIALKDRGIVLYRQTNDRSGDGRTWQVIYLDNNLEMIWDKEYVLPFELELVGYAGNSRYFYLLFSNKKTNNKQFELYEFDFEGNSPSNYTITNLFPMYLSHFEVSDNAAILGGYLNYKPVVIHFGFSNQRPIVLPTIYNRNTEIIQVKVNNDNTITVLISERTQDNRITIAIKHFDKDGALLLSNALEPSEGNNFIFGRVAGDDSGAVLVAGTYSTTKSAYSRGIFISRLGQDGSENSNYYNYADLKNFFNYMKASREKRVRERIARKKIKGKKLRFNYRLLVHEIIDTEDGFIMLGEAFYPKYSSRGSMGYEAVLNPMTGNYLGMYLEGYKYTHAVVIEFDEKGRIKWDNSFEITDVLTSNLNQFVNATVEGDNIVLLYLFENIIRSKIIQGDQVLEGKSYEDLRLKYENDQVRNSDVEFGGIEKWSDDTFVAYGVQRIRNMKDSGVDLNRRVFFVNKLIYK